MQLWWRRIKACGVRAGGCGGEPHESRSSSVTSMCDHTHAPFNYSLPDEIMPFHNNVSWPTVPCTQPPPSASLSVLTTNNPQPHMCPYLAICAWRGELSEGEAVCKEGDRLSSLEGETEGGRERGKHKL